jgi:hypothetical protein
MRVLKRVFCNAALITLCSRCHHSKFIHGDPTAGPCLFSECKCPRFVPKPQLKDSEEADSELRSEVSS